MRSSSVPFGLFEFGSFGLLFKMTTNTTATINKVNIAAATKYFNFGFNDFNFFDPAILTFCTILTISPKFQPTEIERVKE